jgi:hypothetical protein
MKENQPAKSAQRSASATAQSSAYWNCTAYQEGRGAKGGQRSMIGLTRNIKFLSLVAGSGSQPKTRADMGNSNIPKGKQRTGIPTSAQKVKFHQNLKWIIFAETDVVLTLTTLRQFQRQKIFVAEKVPQRRTPEGRTARTVICWTLKTDIRDFVANVGALQDWLITTVKRKNRGENSRY